MVDKRNSARATVKLSVRVKDEHVEEFTEHYAQNISRDGIFIQSKQPCPKGTIVQFEVKLHDNASVLRGKGEVAWTRSPGSDQESAPPGMGIKFLSTDVASAELIQQILLHKELQENGAIEAPIPGKKEKKPPSKPKLVAIKPSSPVSTQAPSSSKSESKPPQDLSELRQQSDGDPRAPAVEKRNSAREKVNLSVRVKDEHIEEFTEHRAHNVSKGGFFIGSIRPCPKGTIVQFEIRLRDKVSVLRGQGEVAWIRPPGSGQESAPAGMGIKFLNTDGASAELIQKILLQREEQENEAREGPISSKPHSESEEQPEVAATKPSVQKASPAPNSRKPPSKPEMAAQKTSSPVAPQASAFSKPPSKSEMAAVKPSEEKAPQAPAPPKSDQKPLTLSDADFKPGRLAAAVEKKLKQTTPRPRPRPVSPTNSPTNSKTRRILAFLVLGLLLVAGLAAAGSWLIIDNQDAAADTQPEPVSKPPAEKPKEPASADVSPTQNPVVDPAPEPDVQPPPENPTEVNYEPAAADPPDPPTPRPRPASLYGFLSISTTPWSEVYLGSHKLGATPLVSFKLREGKYKLRLINWAEKINKPMVITVKAGRTTKIVKRLASEGR